MDETTLRALVAENESDRLELTTSINDTDKFSEAICAFANDLPNHRQPGYLMIGVRDDGEILGARVTDELLKNLGALRDNGNIQPLPTISVEKVPTSRGDVAVVTAQPSPLPPVRYRGRTCIRNGPRRGYATYQEEKLLNEKRVSHALTFDAQPCLGSRMEDMATPLFLIDYRRQAIAPEVIEENQRTVQEQLASLRFFDLAHDCATNAGIVLFGLDSRNWLPGAYIQFLRVDGTSLSDTIQNDRELQGDLLTVLRELDALIDAQLTQFPVDDSALRERNVEAYPRVAVRELLMNAVMHRDYSSTAPLRVTWLNDRLEIQSPGGLYGEASPANFPRQTSYRNPVIAEAMKALGYVNRYGRGVFRAQEALARNDSPPAAFEFDSGFVLATIWRRP
jgi:ATP-dependent DNA helicase RecG